MSESRFPREAWLPIAAGLAWFWCAMPIGVLATLVALVPGSLLLAAGVAQLLFRDDSRPRQFVAAGGLLGALLALPAILVVGLFSALILLALSIACFLLAGLTSIQKTLPTQGVPAPITTLKLAAVTAFDEAILGDLSASAVFPTGDRAARIVSEVRAAREAFAEAGYFENPRSFHVDPPALESPTLRTRSVSRVAFEELSFESGYEPRAGEPGRERWLDFEKNRRAVAWVLRGDPSRPWLVCIHGFRMGAPLIDFGAFDPRVFHRKLGLNMLLPILPLHGPRKQGRRSGDGYLDGDPLDTVHAQAQAMWDIRRMLSWVRGEGAESIGVYGLSLGGYNAALLSCLEADLRCAIAGIPATDFARIFWHHGPPGQIRGIEARGIGFDEVADVMRVVSPLAMPPAIAREARAVFGGVTDRIVPPEQVRMLQDHWEPHEMIWYQGGHMSFASEAEVKRCIDSMLRNRLVDKGAQSAA